MDSNYKIVWFDGPQLSDSVIQETDEINDDDAGCSTPFGKSSNDDTDD